MTFYTCDLILITHHEFQWERLEILQKKDYVSSIKYINAGRH